MSTWRIVAHGWRTFVPVVILNAVVQAATTLPFVVPGTTAGFVALAAVSGLALVAALAFCVAQAAASAERIRFRRPEARGWIASAAAVFTVAVAAVIFAPLVFVALAGLLIVLPALALRRPHAGFDVFAHAPVRAILLTVVAMVLIALLWIGTLLSGFFITGAFSALLSWLALGTIGVVLLSAWTALQVRARGARPDDVRR